MHSVSVCLHVCVCVCVWIKSCNLLMVIPSYLAIYGHCNRTTWVRWTGVKFCAM